jgi:long-chain acyl-CoA synthetase
VALIVPDLIALKKWAAAQGIAVESDEELLANPRAVAHIRSEVNAYSTDWKGFEKVQRVTLIVEDFTTQNGLLTPTLKLKRRVVLQMYGDRLEALYAE